MNKYKIFILDDDKSFVNDIKEYFNSFNNIICKGDTSSNNIIPQLQEFKPDIIILDIIMYPRSGIEVFHQLKRCINTAFIPIVFLSGKDIKEDILEGLEIGAEDYITKPYNYEDLKARIFHIIKKKRSFDISLKILLVDKSNVILKSTEKGLLTENFYLETASSSKNALTQLQNNNFDVIISGASLSDVDGFQFCREVKKKYPQIKFLLLVSEGNIQARAMGIKAGVDDFVLKTLGIDGIKIILKQIISEIKQQNKITKYSISEIDFMTILNSCEAKKFSGAILINSARAEGKVEMLGGEYVSIEYNELTEADALEAIIELKEGIVSLRQKDFTI